MPSADDPTGGRVNLSVSSSVELATRERWMSDIEVRVEPPDVTSVTRDFDHAYPALFRDAYRVAYRLLGNREDSADAAQEACARAYVRWRRLTRSGDPAPWVVRVAGNLAIDRWRRRRTAAAHPLPAPASSETPDRVDLHRALDTLSQRQREVIVLRYFADLPERAVADALGCSVGSVKTHASRAIASLRTALADPDEENR
jgi:RNA polymerase sigma-70 factor (sigma-E family)